ncbi:MAG: DUF1203 domain-containing protein [Proteobacteria bacterium]|nr:DUF1203 domain-containing protein [Pseudomonadota bacterium]MDA1308117.1 DUF1203 domain-containing protein [Pseudomonadota bacterium]
MTRLKFLPIATATVRAYQSGGLDPNGHPAERHISDGDGTPCRHCLADVAAGEPFLILAHRPFPAPQPYAEQGPIFLHAEPCQTYSKPGEMPAMLLQSKTMIIRGYGDDDRIKYGTGQVVATTLLTEKAEELLARDDVAYLHVRSARNNCFQCRIERG